MKLENAMSLRIAGLIAFAFTLLFSGGTLAQTRAAEPLGMVIDVQGKATLTDAGRASRLEMLSYLKPHNEIQLSQGAALTVTWYAGSKELRFSGPARLRVQNSGIEVVQGKPAQERAVAYEKVAATKTLPPRLGQAAISMRGVPKPMTPEQEMQREKLRPAEGAPVGDWVMYAMALEQMGLTGEARGLWRKLSAERPDDPKLRELAGQ
jgi:hypothetical protein